MKRVRIWSFSGLYFPSPNAGKYWPEKLRIRILFTQYKTLKNTETESKKNVVYIKNVAIPVSFWRLVLTSY